MKILVFLHGTVTMHAKAAEQSPEEILRQIATGDAAVYDFASYIPIGKAVQKLHTWQQQGAQIEYLSSRRKIEEIEMDSAILRKYNFPKGPIHFRRDNESYKDLTEKIIPNVLIEDDCESIGGAKQMALTFVRPEIRQKIKSIVVREFGGIDHLPDNPKDLLEYS